jgi:multisubunit Na+/H+ antiporter MnhC subunit
MALEQITLIIGGLLILLGLWGLVTQKNLMKIVISFTLVDTGIHVLMISLGYLRNRTAPIVDDGITDAINQFVDPIPQAMVLTAIVIGLGITALMLSFVVRMAKDKNSLDVSNFKDLKW